ncbi:MAG: DUF3047 domain-containing protein [Candidatus Aureabacteria bacterium]|nr:DUF3047 domain-containing protein [Candidatus Auribacterota bacterium]
MKTIFVGITALTALFISQRYLAGETAFIGKIFSTVSFPVGASLPAPGWKEKVYNARNQWGVVEEGGSPVLHALSNGTASMLYTEVNFNAKEYPLLRWRWKVLCLPRKGKENDHAHDDYGARVYVFFPGWTFLTSYVMEYVWDNENPAGTILTSPSSSRCKLIVVNSGTGDMGKWITVERNLWQDYGKAFGWEPDRNVGAIGFMTDSDNTSSRAEAYYGAVVIGRE